MSLAKSNYLEDAIINHVLRSVAYTDPAAVYAALYTTDPGEGNTGTEVAGGTYARQAITFSAASGGATANTGDLTFTGVPAATIPYIGILDALTTGNLLYYGPLTSPVTVTTGSTVTIPTGALTVSET